MGLVHHLADQLVVTFLEGIANGQHTLTLTDDVAGALVVLLANLGLDLVETSQGSLLIRRVIDGLQVVCEGLHVLVGHVFQRVAHHVDDAPLVFRLGIGRRDGLLQAVQAVRAEDKNVLQSTIFKLI